MVSGDINIHCIIRENKIVHTSQILTVYDGNSKNYLQEVILRLFILFPETDSRRKEYYSLKITEGK